ncbi:MAG: DUF6249 domain-containing protein [Alkalispirochaetaceae bacterium]
METVPSPAAQLMITIIPIVGIVFGSTVVVFFLLWNHKQRMAQIERGMQPRRIIDLRTFSLLLGLLSGAVGLALTLFHLVLGDGGYGLLGGLIPLAVGLGFLAFYRIGDNHEER